MREGCKKAGKLAYGVLFLVVAPLLLFGWARALDRALVFPALPVAWLGWVLATVGSMLALGGAVGLRLVGKGWPMSPFPPERFVTTGAYGLVSHPIYVGSVLISFGMSIASGSGAGVWIVSPTLALACFVFVLGYEKEHTERLFGRRSDPPVIRLPDDSDESPVLADRVSALMIVFLPWYVMSEAVNALGSMPGARDAYMTWERSLPVFGWTELVYVLAYPLALGAPFFAASRRELRGFVLRGWVAMVVTFSIYIGFPVTCVPKPVPEGAPLFTLLEWERMFEEPNTSFPSFHVIWAMLATQVLVRRFPRTRVAGWIMIGAIGFSCVTTGMHGISDVVAGAVVGLAVMRAEAVWSWMIRGCEAIAGSWRETTLGSMRFINHGLYAALGGFVGLLVVLSLQAGHPAAVAAVALGSIIGAGIWAQWLEGSSVLLRPYGFYGGLLGGVATIGVYGLLGHDWMGILAAFGVGVPFAQAIGRLRCLVQGCCHGRPTDPDWGMCYRHPRSRVVRLADLGDVPLHATQLYSILGNLLIGTLLICAWRAALPLSLIAGFYFISTSFLRFVEEHYRGEPQTRVIGGMRLYQWLAIAGVLVGAALQAVPSSPALPIYWPSPGSIAVATTVFALAYFAYGVDFPKSNRRFSRLA